MFVALLTFCMLLGNALASETYTFTNAGATGRNGPTQTQVNTAYAGTNLAGNVTINTQGIQEWTVPASGDYRLEAFGAQGGNGVGDDALGGLGAKVGGIFSLTSGQTIKILVGQRGGNGLTSFNGGGSGGGGGGGGSFIFYSVQDALPILSAGGGGGAHGPDKAGSNASISTSGVVGNGSTGTSDRLARPPGANGSGGGAGINHVGGGGAGWLSNGETPSRNSAQYDGTGGLAPRNGGTGGTKPTAQSENEGGFGGGGSGGSSNGSGAGGGGFSGGSSGDYTFGGGGGGSYNSGTDQNNTAGANTGHGRVIITSLTPIPFELNSTTTLSIAENQSAGTVVGEINATASDANFTFDLSAHTSQDESADTPGAIAISFFVNGAWTPTESFFTGADKGEVKTKTFTTAAKPIKLKFLPDSNNNGWGYWKVVLAGKTILEDQNGSTGSPIGSVPYWVDGDGTGGAPTFQELALPSHTYVFSLVDGDGSSGNSLFTLDSNGILKTSAILDHEANASHSIRVRATDELNASVEKSFDVNVTDDTGDNPISVTYTFTNAGATGRTGPTQTQVNTAYLGTNLAGNVTISTQGIQEWTVPATGTYTIEAWGAQGADNPTKSGGSGSKIIGDFNLNANETITIVVGQTGEDGIESSGSTGGGGGGSSGASVTRQGTVTLLVLAGGGGGAGYSNNGFDGLTSNAGGNGNPNNGASGDGATNQGQGGNASSSFGGYGFTNGIGVVQNDGHRQGGFGFTSGGGAGEVGPHGGGGGGGYSGGGAGFDGGGGGGGSYNSGTNQNNIGGANTGHGKVVITFSQTGGIPPVIAQGAGPLAKTIPEDGSVTWTASDLNATDPDTNASSLTWSISSAPSNGSATVDGNGSSPDNFSYTPHANFNGSDSFTVRVSDGTFNDTISVNVTVTSVNDSPVITQGTGSLDKTIPEDGSVTWAASDLNATDPDTNASSLTWSISSAPSNGTVNVNGNGSSPDNFTYSPHGNFNGSDSFTVRVSDGDLNDTITVYVTVTPVNDGPENLSLSANQITENQPVGTIIGHLSATDPDANATLSFSLVDGNASGLSLDANGTLRVLASLDYETEPHSHLVRIRVTDEHNASLDGNFTIALLNQVEDLDGDGIEDHYDPDDDGDGFPDATESSYGSDPRDPNSVANAAPTSLELNGTSILENQPVGTVIGHLSATDPDAKATLSFSLVDGNASGLSLDANGTLRALVSLDYETEPHSHLVRIRVTDEHNASLEGNFTIALLDDPSDNTTQAANADGNETTVDQNSTAWWVTDADSGNGWRSSAWLGSFRPYSNGWIYHLGLGWAYAQPDELGGLWLWMPNEQWVWSAPHCWPHMWKHGSSDWLYFVKEHEGKPALYDYSTESFRWK